MKHEIIKIYKFEHFEIFFEDVINNVWFPELNNDIELWMKENIKGRYDLDTEWANDPHDIDYIEIEFWEEQDALAFKLRWL